jgi:protoheme IX farnesyltransferase
MKLRIDVFITLSGLIAAMATARGGLSIQHVFWLSMAIMLASASSALFNQYVDRDIDGIMSRTMHRALPAGRVSPREVFLVGSVFGIAGLAIAWMVFNSIVVLHLLLGAFFYAVVYTVWLKRRSWINIVIGGLSGSFAILAGGASVRPELCATPLLLALVMFFWTPSHFWALSMAYRDDYARAGIPMLPVIVGPYKTAWAILANTALLVAASILPFWFGTLGWVYLIGVLMAGGYFIWQNVRLVRDPSPALAWANFKASMAYLGLLMVVVVLDVFVT